MNDILKKCFYIYLIAEKYEEINDSLKQLPVMQNLFIEKVKSLIGQFRIRIKVDKKYYKFFNDIASKITFEKRGDFAQIEYLFVFSNFISEKEIINVIEDFLDIYKDNTFELKKTINLVNKLFMDLQSDKINAYRMLVSLIGE